MKSNDGTESYDSGGEEGNLRNSAFGCSFNANSPAELSLASHPLFASALLLPHPARGRCLERYWKL